jgi:DNA-directed RNA polymerase subunit beta
MQALSLDVREIHDEGAAGGVDDEDELLRAAEELGIDLGGVRADLGDEPAADEAPENNAEESPAEAPVAEAVVDGAAPAAAEDEA